MLWYDIKLSENASVVYIFLLTHLHTRWRQYLFVEMERRGEVTSVADRQ